MHRALAMSQPEPTAVDVKVVKGNKDEEVEKGKGNSL
jgi:hypothetical protein